MLDRVNHKLVLYQNMTRTSTGPSRFGLLNKDIAQGHDGDRYARSKGFQDTTSDLESLEKTSKKSIGIARDIKSFLQRKRKASSRMLRGNI